MSNTWCLNNTSRIKKQQTADWHDLERRQDEGDGMHATSEASNKGLKALFCQQSLTTRPKQFVFGPYITGAPSLEVVSSHGFPTPRSLTDTER
eukprot:5165623-Amphidinium_carterae.2